MILVVVVLTGVEDATANSFLTHTDWKLELAVNEFFENPDMYPLSVNSSPVDKRKLDTLFTKYKGTCTCIIILEGRKSSSLKLPVPYTVICLIFGVEIFWSQVGMAKINHN